MRLWILLCGDFGMLNVVDIILFIFCKVFKIDCIFIIFVGEFLEGGL